MSSIWRKPKFGMCQEIGARSQKEGCLASSVMAAVCDHVS